MVKPLIGYEDRYTIDDAGTVKNNNDKVLGGYISEKGYHYIKTYDGKKHRLHRLVAQTFIANPEEYPEVDHKDENKSNNSVDNLRWCTGQMNKDFYWSSRPRKPKVPVYNQGKVYGTVEAMVEATGKEITVDGKHFISCGSAAQYIVDNTEGKNKATISKELRRYLQGKRSEWVMYDRFTIGY